jgi:hypothetical protein
MNRREFLEFCAKCGLTTAAILAMEGLPITRQAIAGSRIQVGQPNNPQPEPTTLIELDIVPTLKELPNTQLVNVWAWRDRATGEILTPGPVFVVEQGRSIEISIRNLNTVRHQFQITDNITTPVILPGGEHRFEVEFNEAGTFMYLDPSNAPVNRVMGLHGAFIVLSENNTPYNTPTPMVQKIFDDLGTSAHVPGDPWDPTRSWIWMFSTFHPETHCRVQEAAFNGQAFDPQVFANDYLARFFTINGQLGYFSSVDPDISPWGNVGMPGLLRCLNAGMVTFSPHIHGNHVFTLYDNGQVQESLDFVETWMMAPMDIRDRLHPFVMPPEINAWPPSPQTNGRGTFSQFPLVYPMHCHLEMSQTGAGGNYPQGALVHWTILTENIGSDNGVIQPTALNTDLNFEPHMDLFES